MAWLRLSKTEWSAIGLIVALVLAILAGLFWALLPLFGTGRAPGFD